MSPGLILTFHPSVAPVTPIEKSHESRGPPARAVSPGGCCHAIASETKIGFSTPLRTNETSSRIPPGCRCPPIPINVPARFGVTVQSAPATLPCISTPCCGVTVPYASCCAQFSSGHEQTKFPVPSLKPVLRRAKLELST